MTSVSVGAGIEHHPSPHNLVALPRISEESFPETPKIWGEVPLRNPNFTGRQSVIDQLGQSLGHRSSAAVIALHGMGGIGKTQIAVEYIYRHSNEYDVIWWIDATQPARIKTSLLELARRLELSDDSDSNTTVARVRESLRQGNPHRRWLLVFDSAPSSEVVRSFFPASGIGDVLITSRNPDWADIANPVEVGLFTRAESKSLLTCRSLEIDDSDADDLATKLGDLPLAIEQAAAWRVATGMPIREYSHLLDGKVAEILNASLPLDYQISVGATWTASFDELRTQHSAAYKFLQLCSFMAPEPILRSFFHSVPEEFFGSDLDSLLRDPLRLSQAVGSIHRFGLAKIDYQTDSFVVHRLVQLVLRGRMSAKQRVEAQQAASHLLASLDPGNPESSRQWPRYRTLLPHAYAADVVESELPTIRHFVVNLIKFIYFSGDHQAAIVLAQRASSTWVEKFGEPDLYARQATECLAYYYWVVGRYAESAEINQRNSMLDQYLVDDDGAAHEISRLSYARMAHTRDLKARGDFRAARRHTEEVYESLKAEFGEEHPNVVLAAFTHGISLRLCGEYRQAAALDEKNYRISVELYDPNDDRLVSALSTLILDRREAGDYAWARAEYEKLVHQIREVLGDGNPDSLRRFAYLAVTRRKAGDYQGALELSKDVTQRYIANQVEDSFNAMAITLAYSIDLKYAGDLDGARVLGQQVFDRYRRVFGESHPYTSAAAINLGVTLRLLGDFADARELTEPAISQLRTSLGDDHPYVIMGEINLANIRFALGDYHAALALDSEAVNRAQRVLGPDHHTTLAASLNQAQDLRKLGKTQKSETIYADAVTGCRRVLGDTHPWTISAVQGIRTDCDIDPLPL